MRGISETGVALFRPFRYLMRRVAVGTARVAARTFFWRDATGWKFVAGGGGVPLRARYVFLLLTHVCIVDRPISLINAIRALVEMKFDTINVSRNVGSKAKEFRQTR